MLEANAPLRQMAGMPRGQLVGLPLTSLVAGEDVGRVREALHAVAARGGTNAVEVNIVPRIGASRLVTLTVMAIVCAERSGHELVVRIRDTTEHAGLVAELNRTIEWLERSNEELAALARIAAHDLAAPLRALSGLVDLLPQADLSPDTKLTLDAIRAAVDRMESMVAGIAGYARAGSSEPMRALVDLNELVARVTEMLETDIEELGAGLTVDALPSVFGDEHQLERVFLNLMSNALKYSGEHAPDIHIYADRGPGAWRISVADRGIGVGDADRERIFELFVRGEARSGTGIGLATCRRIVEMHGGHVWVEPNDPTGAVFSFTLPDEPTVAGG